MQIQQSIRAWVESQRSPVGRAARRFSTQKRLEYFGLLADLLEDTQGRTQILQIFLRDAKRYGNKPRGVLSKHWAERYETSGASLKAAWSGTLPAEEVNMIGVAEEGGSTSTITALRDLARVGEVIRQSRNEFLMTVAVGLFAIVMATSMIVALPLFFAPYLRETYSFIPSDFYGRSARNYFEFADFVGKTWYLLIAAMLAVVWWLAWALPNWVGPRRAVMDEKFLVFKLYRDFKGSIFMAMLASLTKSRGGAVTNQRNALMMMQSGASPWLAWKIRMMINRIDEEGGLDASMLDVGVVDKEVFYLFADIFEARGVAAGLTAAGLRSEERATKTIANRAKILRWGALFASLAVMITLLGWQNAVIYEFKGTVSAYFNSR